MDCYLIKYKLRKTEAFCLWYTGTEDGLDSLFHDHARRVLSFESAESACRYLESTGYNLSDLEVGTYYNFDKLFWWIESADRTTHCEELNNFWNLFTDVASTVGVKFTGDKKRKDINRIYDKLFAGRNLRVFKPDDVEDYVPAWTESELYTMKAILKNGASLFIRSLTPYRES